MGVLTIILVLLILFTRPWLGPILNILLVLCGLLALFDAFNKLFGWAHRYGWTFLISQTEAKLPEKALRQYSVCLAVLGFLDAVWFFLCLFDQFHAACKVMLPILTILLLGVELYYSRIAKTC